MEDLEKKRDKLSEKLRLPGYYGALTRISKKTKKSYGYVRQVLIIKDRWNDRIVLTAAEVIKEMDNERLHQKQEKVKVLEQALA